MPGSLPLLTDFDSHLQLIITPPPASQDPVNVLVLLHGLGDSTASFANLAKQLALPETACISLQGPAPLPFDLHGFHWGDDIIFNQATGQMDFDTGFVKATHAVSTVIRNLKEKCEYQSREIMVFGFGQGGMAALATISSLQDELAGAVSIGGPLPFVCASRSNAAKKNKTPVIVLGGSSHSLITADAVTRIRSAFQFVEYKQWPNKVGDGMPRSHEEMLPVMHFFSRRLRSRRGVPEGSVEIG